MRTRSNDTSRLTPFGKWLRSEDIQDQTAAIHLGVSTSYVGMLAFGNATPRLKLAGEIKRWSKGQVPMESWLPYCK